jgi:hypothetical protein
MRRCDLRRRRLTRQAEDRVRVPNDGRGHQRILAAACPGAAV